MQITTWVLQCVLSFKDLRKMLDITCWFILRVNSGYFSSEIIFALVQTCRRVVYSCTQSSVQSCRVYTRGNAFVTCAFGSGTRSCTVALVYILVQKSRIMF